MTQTFTSNDVMRYFYGEVSKDEKNEIEEAIAFDSSLQDIYCGLEEMTRLLESKNISPNTKTVDSILAYSKSFAHIH